MVPLQNHASFGVAALKSKKYSVKYPNYACHWSQNPFEKTRLRLIDDTKGTPNSFSKENCSVLGSTLSWPGKPTTGSTKRQRVDFNRPGNRLAVKLLELVGRGDAHVHTAAEIARVALDDSGHNPASGLQGLASCGTNGKHSNNTERDFRRMVRDTYNMHLEPYTINLELEVPYSKTLQVDM